MTETCGRENKIGAWGGEEKCDLFMGLGMSREDLSDSDIVFGGLMNVSRT